MFPRNSIIKIGGCMKDLTGHVHKLYRLGSCVNILNLQLKEKLLENVRNSDRILDIPCGTGDLTYAIAQKTFSDVIGIDNSRIMIDHSRSSKTYHNKTVCFFLADARKMPFRNETFDLVVSIFGVSAVKTPEFVKEIYRVLVNGGRIILIDIFLERDLPNEVKNSCFFRETDTCIHGAKRIGEQIVELKECGFKVFSIERGDEWIEKLLRSAKHFEEKLKNSSARSIVFTEEELRSISLVVKLYIKVIEENLLSCGMIIASK
jgi:ubiquinone/menaquinone biosynthesis C-methylase UbiE